MSSDGGEFPTTTGTASSPQNFYCYQCDLTVSLTLSPSSDLICPFCHGGFLEEVPSPSPPHHHIHHRHLTPPFVTSPSDPLDPLDFSAIFSSRSPFRDSDVFNPFHFLQTYLNNMRAGGTNIQFVIENSPSAAAAAPANLGDYFFGPGLEQLIQQLAENDPNRYGTPPASKSAVEGLPTVSVTKEVLGSDDSSQCAVCMEEFELGAEAKMMPCKHVFHNECIVPWLELHNSCPVCRFELPTDDPDYEQRGRGSGGVGNNSNNNGGGGGGGDGGEGLQSDRTVGRRFRISLPWPFEVSGNPAESSHGSGGGGGGGGGTNSHDRDNREGSGFGSETRQEELD